MRFTHRWQWGALGSLVLLALWFRPDLPPAWAQGVGIYSRATCTQINSPVAGQTVCYNQTTSTWQNYDGQRWTEAGVGRVLTLQNGTAYFVNNFLDGSASGTNNQAVIAASISGVNTGGSVARIAILGMAQTGGGASSTNQPVAGNFVCQQRSADIATQIVCVEMDMNNNLSDDALDPGSGHYLLSLVNAGGKISGPAALNISSSSGAANAWRRGILIATNSIANFAFDYLGNGFGAVKITASGSILNGNVADMGGGTINTASATFMNNLASQVASGSGINLQNIRGLSASSNLSNNLRGTCTFAGAATCAVTFANNERDANYFVLVGGVVDVSAKATTGFTLTATGTRSNSVDWMLVR